MKKRVQYADLGFVAKAKSALIVPLDHPNSALNGGWVRTSRVLKMQPTVDGPVFETEFTIYWPEQQEPMPVTFLEGKLNV